jgi:hypothetical protein
VPETKGRSFDEIDREVRERGAGLGWSRAKPARTEAASR